VIPQQETAFALIKEFASVTAAATRPLALEPFRAPRADLQHYNYNHNGAALQ